MLPALAILKKACTIPLTVPRTPRIGAPPALVATQGRIAHIVNGSLNISQRPSDTGDSGFDHSCYRSVVLAAKSLGRLDFAVVNVVTDVIHKVFVDFPGLCNHPPFLAENEDCDQGKYEEYYHNPTTLGGHLEDGDRLDFRLGGNVHDVCLEKC